MGMRIGMFGGSFDPIHLGHLILAEQCREQAELDEVWFIPSAIAPHKGDGAMVSGRQRLEMVELAIAGHEAFRAEPFELERSGISYTVETLERLVHAHPDDAFFLLVGSDSLEQFPTWREPARICQLAQLLVYERPGHPVDPDALLETLDAKTISQIVARKVAPRQIDISSTDLRARIAAGRTIRYLVPRAVEAYIRTHRLYR